MELCLDGTQGITVADDVAVEPPFSTKCVREHVLERGWEVCVYVFVVGEWGGERGTVSYR